MFSRPWGGGVAISNGWSAGSALSSWALNNKEASHSKSWARPFWAEEMASVKLLGWEWSGTTERKLLLELSKWERVQSKRFLTWGAGMDFVSMNHLTFSAEDGFLGMLSKSLDCIAPKGEEARPSGLLERWGHWKERGPSYLHVHDTQHWT